MGSLIAGVTCQYHLSDGNAKLFQIFSTGFEQAAKSSKSD